MKHILYIGLDVHKDSIAIAVAESGRNGELRSWGNISNSVPAMEKAIARMRKQYGLEVELHFCYSRAGRDRLHSCSPEGGGSRQRRPLRVYPRPSPPAAWPRVHHRGTIKDPSAIWLVPSEATSGPNRRQGTITKCGNPHARWLLIECSQHYGMPPKISRDLSRRQEGQPRDLVKISWKAQNRLHGRLTRLLARRVHRNKALVAVARELVGFIWHALRDLPCYQADLTSEKNAT